MSKRSERHDEKICLDVSSQTSEDDICHVGEVILDNPGLSMEQSQDLEMDNTISSFETSMSSVDYNNSLTHSMIMMFLNQVLRLLLMFLQKPRQVAVLLKLTLTVILRTAQSHLTFSGNLTHRL